MPVDDAAVPPRFPAAAGIFLGLGLGGLFDGIVLHQLLQRHHMATSAGVQGVAPALEALRNLKLNTFLDGLFDAGTYSLILIGLFRLWKASHLPQVHGSTKVLVGTFLIGFGLFNLVKACWTTSFSRFTMSTKPYLRTSGPWVPDLGAAMVVGGWLICSRGRGAERASRSRP